VIDPTSIEDYPAVGGYSALAKALFDMTLKGIIDEIKGSGLRGRGGGGLQQGKSGRPAAFKRVNGMSSVMRTRGTQAHTWIEVSWRGIRTAFWRE